MNNVLNLMEGPNPIEVKSKYILLEGIALHILVVWIISRWGLDNDLGAHQNRKKLKKISGPKGCCH